MSLPTYAVQITMCKIEKQFLVYVSRLRFLIKEDFLQNDMINPIYFTISINFFFLNSVKLYNWFFSNKTKAFKIKVFLAGILKC